MTAIDKIQEIFEKINTLREAYSEGLLGTYEYIATLDRHLSEVNSILGGVDLT